MAKERKAQRLYVVHRQRDGAYYHAEIHLMSDEDRSLMVRLTWQADRSRDYWYACEIEVKAENLESLQRATAELRRIWRGREQQPDWWYQPQQAVADLEAAGWLQGAYDPRQHRYVPVRDWLDPEISLWGDDHKVVGADYGMATALAKTADEARKAIAKALAERAAEGNARYADYLARWVAAGQPVRLLEAGRPAPAPALEILRLGWASPPSEAAEVELARV